MRKLIFFLLLLYATPLFATVDPVGWWKFDGDATDSGSGGNNGTAVNTPTYVAGYIGTNALNFDGLTNGQYVSIGNPAAVQITGNITISAWFAAHEMPPVNDYLPIAGKGYVGGAPDSQAYLFRIATDSGGVTTFDCGTYENGNSHYAQWTFTFTVDIAADSWYNAICRFDGSAWKIFINGAEEASLTDSTAPVSNTANFLIAAEETDGVVERWWNGKLDDVRLYNRALTSQEIADLVSQTEGGAPVVARHKPIIFQ